MLNRIKSFLRHDRGSEKKGSLFMNCLVIGMNPTVDRTIRLKEKLQIGSVYHPDDVREEVGGSGINAATVMARFGEDIKYIGFVGGERGHRVRDKLREEGMQAMLVETEAQTGICTRIIDCDGNTMEINELGGPIKSAEYDRFLDIINREISTDIPQFALLCGSLPQGVDITVLKKLIRRLNRSKVNVIADLPGELLCEILGSRDCKLFMIKPNVSELYKLYEKERDTDREMVKKMLDLTEEDFYLDRKAERFAVRLFNKYGTNILGTLGPKGSFYVSECVEIETKTLTVTEVNRIEGAGDVYLGCFLYACNGDFDKIPQLEYAIRAATSAATVYISKVPDGLPRASEMGRYMHKLQPRIRPRDPKEVRRKRRKMKRIAAMKMKIKKKEVGGGAGNPVNKEKTEE